MPEKACGLDRHCAWRAEEKLGLPPGSICIGLDLDGDPCGKKAVMQLGGKVDKWNGDTLYAPQPFCQRHAQTILIHARDQLTSAAEFQDVVDERIDERKARVRENRARKPDMVYFAKRGDQIKIGHSTIPKRRLRDLANAAGAPFDAVVVAKGGWTREQGYHIEFEEDRIQGEWFAFTDSIAREMARLSQLPSSTTLENWPS